MTIAMRYRLIHPTACGFMPEVDVHDVIYPLNALRDWAQMERHTLSVLRLDQFKAYDTLNWGGLFAYLEYAGMSKLAQFLFAAYSQTSWAFITGYGLTKQFTPTNGGAQSCWNKS